MSKSEKLKKIYKNKRFLQAGFALLNVGATTLFGVGGMYFRAQGHDVLSGFFTFGAVLGITTSIFSTLFSFTDNHFIVDKINDSIQNHIENNGVSLFEKYVSKEKILTNENLELRKLCIKAFQKIDAIDFTELGFQSIHWQEESKASECLDSIVIQDIYKKEYLQSAILGKQFVQVISHKSFYKEEMDLFLALMKTQEGEYTVKDLAYIASHFPRVENKKFLDYLANRENFAKLGETIQTIILTQKDNEYLDSALREKLLSFYDKNEEVKLAKAKVKEFKEEVSHEENILLKEESFKVLVSFKSILEKVYGNNEMIEKTLNEIENLLITREKFMTYLSSKPNQYFDVNHFLKEDVDKTIENFTRETQILNKMKLFSHEQFSNQKDVVLNSIVERLNLITIQMSMYKEKIEKDLIDELGHEMEINKKVLTSKMSA